MTPEELTADINRIVSNAENRLGEAMYTIGMETTAAIRQRVQQTGQTAEGNLFDPYSVRPMLANCSSMTKDACQKIAGSKAKRKELKWVTLKRGEKNTRLFILPEGYNQFRDLHGRQTGFVDFTFSGRMWGNITVVSSDAEHRSGVAVITAMDDKEYDKLAGNTRRRGDILDMNDAEIERAGEVLEEILFKDWE